MSNAGRPALPGPREPNGRLSRRGVDRNPLTDFNYARRHWRSFVDSFVEVEIEQPRFPRTTSEIRADAERRHQVGLDHPLLHQVRIGKLRQQDFLMILWWAATKTPNLNWHFRDNLTKVTGFDFRSKPGCEAARRIAVKELGDGADTILDRAAFSRTPVNVTGLPDMLDALWNAWAEHGLKRGTPK